jgi:hypothetical protein
MPAVVLSFYAQIKPGGVEHALDLTRQAVKPIERSGATSVRVFRGASGDAYGAILLASEYGSSGTFGSSYDRLMADDEVRSLISATEGANTPYTTQSISISSEIPLGTTARHGPVMMTTIARPNPGRLVDTINLTTKAAQAFGRYNVGTRLWQIVTGGAMSQCHVVTMEYASMTEFGKAGDALANDQELQQVLMEAMGSTPPSAILTQDLFTEVQV